MAFGMLFLLLLATGAWWLHSRWSALRNAQAARREAEMMMVFEARSTPPRKPGSPPPATAPSDFYPTLPGAR